jgi:hypothetical protein
MKIRKPKVDIVDPDNVFTDVVKSIWRNNMWVMTPKGIGIMFKMGTPCCIHLVNPENGLTIEPWFFPIGQLRQAKWEEIPECRRMISREKGRRLGYM